MLPLWEDFWESMPWPRWSQHIDGVPDIGFLQRMLRRIQHSGGPKIRGTRLRDDAAVCIGQSEADGSDGGGGGDCDEPALRIHSADNADAGKHL